MYDQKETLYTGNSISIFQVPQHICRMCMYKKQETKVKISQPL